MRNGVYKFTLDVLRSDSQYQVSSKRYDTARSFRITLMAGGRPYRITEGCTANMIIKRPDAAAILDSCEIDIVNSVIRYEFNDSTASIPGLNECEVVITGSDGEILTSPRFGLWVSETLYEDGQSHGFSHKELQDTDAEDSHPMSAITGLNDALDSKIEKEALDPIKEDLEKKADKTDYNQFTQVVDGKAEKSYVDDQLKLKADKSEYEKNKESVDADIKKIREDIVSNSKTIERVSTTVASPFKFKGNVATLNDLPADAAINDTYYVLQYRCLYTKYEGGWSPSSMSSADYDEVITDLKDRILGENSVANGVVAQTMNVTTEEVDVSFTATEGEYLTVNNYTIPTNILHNQLENTYWFEIPVVPGQKYHFYGYFYCLILMHEGTIRSAENQFPGKQVSTSDGSGHISMSTYKEFDFYVPSKTDRIYVSGTHKPGEYIKKYANTYTVKAAAIDQNLAVRVSTLETEVGKQKEDIANIPLSADVDDDKQMHVRGRDGIILFTVDLSGLGGETPTYGEIIPSVTEVSVKEGGTGSFSVKLQEEPTNTQLVYIASSDPTRVTMTPSVLSFTSSNWNKDQEVIVTALEDDDTDDNDVTISITSKKVSAKDILVKVEDNDFAIVSDGLVYNFDSTDWDGTSATMTDQYSGVSVTGLANWQRVGNGINAITSYKSIDFVNSTELNAMRSVVQNAFEQGHMTFEIILSHHNALRGAHIVYPGNPNGSSFYGANGGCSDCCIRTADQNMNLLGKLFVPSEHGAVNGEPFVIHYVIDGQTIKVYVNGIFAVENKFSETPVNLADYNSGSYAWKAVMVATNSELDIRYIVSVRYYDRILSMDEMKRNFNAQSAKMGLSTFI